MKRKGTKDYTKSIKKNKPIQSQAPSEMSTASIQGIYKQKHKDNLIETNIYAEVSDDTTSNERINNSSHSNYRISPDQGESNEMDSLEMKNYKKENNRLPHLPQNLKMYHSEPSNPLSQTNRYLADYEDIESFVKGPYIISDKEIDHICFRNNLGNNNVSEL